MRERLRQRQDEDLGRLELIHGSTISSDGRSWRMVGDNKARGARHGDRYWFLQTFGSCKCQRIMLYGHVFYESDSGPRVVEGVGWPWAAR